MLNLLYNYMGYSMLVSEKGYIVTIYPDAELLMAESDLRNEPRYQRAVERNRGMWTYEPDEDGVPRFYYTAPYYDMAGDIAGVITTGLDLAGSVAHILTTEGESAFAFVVNESGRAIIASVTEEAHASYGGENKILDLFSDGNPELAAVAHNITSRENGVERAHIEGSEYFIAYALMYSVPWSLVIAVEIDEIIAPALASRQRIIGMTNDALRDIDLIIISVVAAFAVIIALSVLIVGYSSRRFANSLTQPITTLQEGVRHIADGNLEHVITLQTGDEIEALGLSVNKMALDLKAYIANLTEITAEKERIGAELNIAKKIQSDMLPSIFPAFPGRSEFDIYASMEPAKEIGGDFYDFFLIDDDHLGIVMADVSGKSVPAALFMVIAKTLINNRARDKEEPQDVFINVNNQLREGNETAMFVTAWFGVLTISTGKVTFVNAGHNPPLLKKADGSFEYLKTKKGFVLAGMDGFKYKQLEMTLEKGDILFLYTDGVTEQFNNEEELYGEERLKNTLDSLAGLPLTEMLPRIKEDISLFADGAPQFDDITMLALKINNIGGIQ